MSHNTGSNFLRTQGVNITIKDIAEGYSKEKIRAPSLAKYLQSVYDQQVLVEDLILKGEKWCAPIVNHKPELINLDQLEKYVSKKNSKMLNGRALEALACVANNIISIDNSVASTARGNVSLFRKYLTDVRLIGAASERGYAMSVGIVDKIDNAFVIKVDKDTNGAYSRHTMRHEVVAGLILNSLRPIIPNFAYMFGSFECGGPILTLKNNNNSDNVEALDIDGNVEPKIESWCRGGEIQTYAVYENINHSMSLKDYVKTCSSQQYMDILIQIMFALKVAYERVGFTHYDLHYDNVLVRSYEQEGFYIPYDEYYVEATKIATIIDYGMSHVYYNNVESGKMVSLGLKEASGGRGNAAMLNVGTYMDRPNPIMDCYKILWWTLMAMNKYNHKVYKEVRDLIRFFHKDDSFELIFVSYPEGVYGFIPSFATKILSDQSSKFNYMDFIYFCREYCKYKNLEDPVYRADELPEDSKDLVLLFKSPGMNNPVFNDTPADDIKTAEELFDLFDPISIKAEAIRNKLKKTTSESQRVKLNASLDNLNNSYFKIKDKYVNMIRKMLDDLINRTNKKIDEIKTIEYIKIPERDPMTIFEPEIFSKLNTQIRRVSSHLDLLDSIENNFEIIDSLKFFFDIVDDNINADMKMFREKDTRLKIRNFVEADVALLKRNLRDFDLDKFTDLGDFLLSSYSNIF